MISPRVSPNSPFFKRGRKFLERGVSLPSREWFLSFRNRGGFKHSPRFAIQPAKAAARFRWGRWQFRPKASRFFQFPFLDELERPLLHSNFLFHVQSREGGYPSEPLSFFFESYLKLNEVVRGVRSRLELSAEFQPAAVELESGLWKKFKSGYFIRMLGTRFFLPNSRTRGIRLPRTTRRVYFKNRIALAYLQLLSHLISGLKTAPTGVRRLLLAPPPPTPIRLRRRRTPPFSLNRFRLAVALLLAPVNRFAKRALPAQRNYWFKLLRGIRVLFRSNPPFWSISPPLPHSSPFLIKTFIIPSSRGRVVVRAPLLIFDTPISSLGFSYLLPPSVSGGYLSYPSLLERWWKAALFALVRLGRLNRVNSLSVLLGKGAKEASLMLNSFKRIRPSFQKGVRRTVRRATVRSRPTRYRGSSRGVRPVSNKSHLLNPI